MLSYHCLKGAASTTIIEFLTRVFVRTNSLLEELYTTSMTRVFLVCPSEPHAKLPESSLRALTFWLPPRVLTVRTRLGISLVLAAWRPNSYFLFLWGCFLLPPVALLLCQ